MKLKKEIEVTQCDFCSGTGFPQACEGCGKDVCSDYRDERRLTPRCGTTFITKLGLLCGGDPVYCPECEPKLRANPTKRFAALLKLEALRAEGKAWREAFDKRVNKAEAAL